MYGTDSDSEYLVSPRNYTVHVLFENYTCTIAKISKQKQKQMEISFVTFLLNALCHGRKTYNDCPLSRLLIATTGSFSAVSRVNRFLITMGSLLTVTDVVAN